MKTSGATRPAPLPVKSPGKPVPKPVPVLGKPAAALPSRTAAPRAAHSTASATLAWAGKSKPASPKPVALSPAPGENEAPVPTADDPNRARIVALQEALTHIVRGSVLGRLRVGMRVLDLATGHVLFSRRGSVLMDPASNQKVLATATALLRLGSTWRFRTELSGSPPDGEGTVAGDLILRGSGDPSLRDIHLDAMAEDLARRGITRIEGRVLGDPRRLGSDEATVTGRSPVRVGWSAIEVHVRPGDKVGANALASLRPGFDAFRLVNQAVTGKGRNRLAVSVSRVGDHIQVLVTGKIGLGRRGTVIRRAPPGDTLYAAILMRAALIRAGIEVRGMAGVHSGEGHDHLVTTGADLQLASATILGDTPAALMRKNTAASKAILGVHESAPLPLLIRRVNKNSDNEWAERVLEATGAETYGGSANTAKGVRALREALTDLGVASSGYLPANGSGLGHQNRVTPTAMADLLRRLYFDPRVGPDLLQSLSVGGVDGTTRNRFRGSSAAERVRAKTGTLNGVSCLSGYVGDKADVVAFSIMVEGHRHRAVTSVRSAQVSAVNAMMRYARGTLGPAPAENAMPTEDLETGGESAELEGEADLPESAPTEKPGKDMDQMLKDFGTPGNDP
jgi:D-alanyl-D-alanine carboxypeptidase/D-alanyl-D-alanine-endopeptidase (penicillin-binding protein 4)